MNSANPLTTIGGLPITVETCEEAARYMLDFAFSRRGKALPPLYSTSANGQVVSACALEPETKALFEEADIIHADGEPLVRASRMLCKTPLPERVATTDLIHNTARLAQAEKASFYFLGASQDQVDLAVENMKRLYPGLIFAGHHDGYVSKEQEDGVVEEINNVAPDILWIGMGVPREQQFVSRNLSKLTNVGVIKTSGGLFNFLSGKNKRAPLWMQTWGLEWVYRIGQEPRRLLWRYLTTNPHAVWLLLTRSR
ncbi:WecB/TagA/CpsF family glycosyltransferase [Cohaesibacter celericrescens]|uniref:Glycosyltransferase n=1 Tax=Cohaesibacter celericrescens TaxID=2067669 RepID=A0A2N5XN87_9HYPH|nr:WecB/TagA/CpsF family glycosyltransferase [Cohaesibacter celericrescens]PLW75877.1 glycosyltransferase [Cohaesibacter celericrescens]